MAQAMLCDGCEERPAVLLITHIQTGEVLAFCVGDSAVWAETHAKALLEALGEDYPGQLGSWLSGPPAAVQAAPAAEPDADQPADKPKRARKPRKPADAEYDPNRTVAAITESAPTPPDEHGEGVKDDGVLLQRDS